MAKRVFKAESKRLLEMMINSIYTHKEIFLRELLSNASDATDKLYYNGLSEGVSGLDRDKLEISIEADKNGRTLTISDHGAGMTKEELETNLGTIAKSGTLAFKQEHGEDAKENDVDLIGQFGVGFYSAFMVAKKVEVVSRSFNSEEAYKWTSEGADGYTITPALRTEHGTSITLTIKDNEGEENYDEFLDSYRIESLVKKYSDYIRYPIVMDVEKTVLKEGTEDEYETITEKETLNSMVPIWKKQKSEVKDEEYTEFYRNKFYAYDEPVKVINSTVEGLASYTALLFVPEKAPYNYYSKEYEKGLQLYSNGVLIMDKCKDLLPDYFGFIKGIVDSPDLSLNISREMLQHDRQLKVIKTSLEKRIKTELINLMKNDREKYNAFYKSFGLQLKFGVYNEYGRNKDVLKDLIMFYSSNDNKYVSLQEYVDNMKEEQKYIYYVSAESPEKANLMPQTEAVKEKGYEILYLTEYVDEFAVKVLGEYAGKEFKSVSDKDLGLEENEKEDLDKKIEENKDLFQELTGMLEGKVKEVRLTNRLVSHPVCLTTDGDLSLEMERILNSMANKEEGVKAERVLEINANHPIFAKLQELDKDNKEELGKFIKVLYGQAELIEGLSVENPVEFSNLICDIMVK